MRKALMAAVVLSIAGWVWADARPGVVRTLDGVVYDGTVDEGDQTVNVDVHGITTTLPRGNIASITYGDFEQRWDEEYAKLGKKDSDGRVALGRKAFDNHRYDLAEKAMRDALDVDPNNAEAAQLLKLTIDQRRLERDQPIGGGPVGHAAPATTGSAGVGRWSTLTPAQINRVKQVELRDNDATARFAFDKNVRKRFYDDNPGMANRYPTYGDFLKEPNVTQAVQIIRNGGDLAKDVRIVNDPDVLLTFRRDVLPLVLQGCATSGCHGGHNAASAKFALITPAAEPAAIYTDFYVLQSTQVTRAGANKPMIVDNTVIPGTTLMIDRTRPETSLLLKYALPDMYSNNKHPYVRGYNGIFRNTDDPRYQTVLQFINSLNPIPQDYGFKFKLERLGEKNTPTTQPAAEPATRP